MSKGTWQGTLSNSQNSLCGSCTFRFDIVVSKHEAPNASCEPSKVLKFSNWKGVGGPVALACIDREFCGHFPVRTKLKDSCPAQLP